MRIGGAPTTEPMAVPATASVPPIEVSFPSLAAYAAGNCGIPYAWTFAARRTGPHVLVQP